MKDFGFFRAAAGVPLTVPADVKKNTAGILALYERARDMGAGLVAFPELAVTAYTCGDLFGQERLLWAAREAALELAAATGGRGTAGKGTAGSSGGSGQGPLMVFGLPLKVRGLLFNCAVLAGEGKILGIVPKTYLPNSGEFYEQRWFTSGRAARELSRGPGDFRSPVDCREPGDFREPIDCREVEPVPGAGPVPFGTDLLFCPRDGDSGPVIGLEICEDLWAPVPPSLRLALGGASLIVNISASNETAGKAAYREELVRGQSARCMAAYLYVSAGPGESSTDLVFGGDSLIAENGRLLARGQRFSREAGLLAADTDIAFLESERARSSGFSQGVLAEAGAGALDFRRVFWGEVPPGAGSKTRQANLSAALAAKLPALLRPADPMPFIPGEERDREDRCQEVLGIQSSGLAARLSAIGCRKAVLGLSGGLDSTLALLVTVRAFDMLKFDRKDICCLTMPGFGTTGRTLGNAETLSRCLGVSLETVDIREACLAQFKDLGHSGKAPDTVYENVQARYRTAVLMNKANMIGGLVVGTGDLSELALGWCTYNGDHMSMYGVNAGVPKTLVRHLVAHAAARPGIDEKTAAVLRDILDTPISPELLPPDKHGKIAQKTEDRIGPYELHDFFLYNAVRRGFSPAKVFFLARQAWENGGEVPAGAKPAAPGRYGSAEILKWLEVFYRRFFSQQFKRSCMPDGPKVGTISLSPRGDWRMPSDASAETWLREIEDLKKRL